MLRFSNKQMVILSAIADFQKSGKSVIELDEICDAVKDELDPDNTLINFRSGVGACLRDLERKMNYAQLTLTSNHMIGRGNKLAFTIRGDYAKLVGSWAREPA
jgi:hypothetical protein